MTVGELLSIQEFCHVPSVQLDGLQAAHGCQWNKQEGRMMKTCSGLHFDKDSAFEMHQPLHLGSVL